MKTMIITCWIRPWLSCVYSTSTFGDPFASIMLTYIVCNLQVYIPVIVTSMLTAVNDPLVFSKLAILAMRLQTAAAMQVAVAIAQTFAERRAPAHPLR